MKQLIVILAITFVTPYLSKGQSFSNFTFGSYTSGETLEVYQGDGSDQYSSFFTLNKPSNSATEGEVNLIFDDGSTERKLNSSPFYIYSTTWYNNSADGSFSVYLNPDDINSSSAEIFVRYSTTGGLEYESSRVNVTRYYTLTADAGSDSNIPCNGNVEIGGVNAASGGKSPYTYYWSPSSSLSSGSVPNPIASPTATTEYELVVIDANGRESAPDYVTVNINEISTNLSVTGFDDFYLPCDPNGSASYRYDISGIPENADVLEWETEFGYISSYYTTNGFITGIRVTVGEDDFVQAKRNANSRNAKSRDQISLPIIKVPNYETFKVICTAKNSCSSIEFEKVVNIKNRFCMPILSAGGLSRGDSPDVLVFPNTVEDNINIQFEANYSFQAEINIYNSNGVKIENLKNDKFKKGENKLYFNNLDISKGLYFLRIEDGKNVYFSSRIIKE